MKSCTLTILYLYQESVVGSRNPCYNKLRRICNAIDRKGMVSGMKMTASEKRLTWEQIRKNYPDQWVALMDVKYMDDDGINVESAVVVCGMEDCDYVEKRLKFMKEGKRYEYERTEDTRGFVGVTV